MSPVRLLASLLGLIATGAVAGPLELVTRIGAPGHNDIGYTIALTPSRIVIGDSDWSYDNEAVFLFDAATGEPAGHLSPPDARWYGPYARALATDGERILVCSHGHGGSAGSPNTSLLFATDLPRVAARFGRPEGEDREHGQFGRNCAVSADHVAISATRWDGAHKDEGTVYLYDALTGALIRKIRAPEPRKNGLFGSEVALSGGLLAIAQANTNGKLPWHGSVYVYDVESGALRHVFRRPKDSRGYFATSLAMADGRILIGSTIDRVERTKSGLAFLYDLKSRALIARLAPPPEHDGHWFASTLTLWEDYALVGAFDADLGARKAGAAYLFDATDGALLQVLAHPAPEARAEFGAALDLGPAGAVIGAPGEWDSARGAGAVYHYRWRAR